MWNMHRLPAEFENRIVDYILENQLEKIPLNDKSWADGHDLPISGEKQGGFPWLSCHKDMSSPGEITLHRDNIRNAFWSFIQAKHPRCLHYPNLCRSLVYMVLVHERFHHFCDVFSCITRYRGGKRVANNKNNTWDWEPEEALATAWEWQELQRSCSAFSKLPASLQKEWNDWWFEGITASGYKDWKDYRHFCFFKDGLAQHLIDPDAPVSAFANAALIEWLYAQLLAQQWCDDAVVYRMEAHHSNTALSPPCFPPLHASSYWIESGADQPLCKQVRKSLQGVHKEIKYFNGVLCLNGNPVSEALLGLVLIEGLQRISLTGLNGKLLRAVEIVNKYLGQGKAGVVHCQSELLDAGLDDFAKL